MQECAFINEVNAGKMRVFLPDAMFDQEKDAKGRRMPIPFGKDDCTVFRKVMSTDDTICEFAPSLRTNARSRALRLALQVLGNLCGLGINYFDFDNVGYVKTATEISSDDSTLMRNIRKNENALAAPFSPARGPWGASFPTRAACACCSTTPSCRTRLARSDGTWTRWPPGSWTWRSAALSGTERARGRLLLASR